jgi:hypothetical protein
MPIVVLFGLFLLYCMAVAGPTDIERGRLFWKRWEKVLLILTIGIWARSCFCDAKSRLAPWTLVC